MGNPDVPFIEFFTNLQSWFLGPRDPDNLSRVFWMPDNSCHKCFECEHSFNLINRKHHCRKCGKIFCGACTNNTIPYQSRTITGSASSCDDSGSNYKENTRRIRVCNHCYGLWEGEMAMSAASTCSSASSETNSKHASYDRLNGLSGFYYDLPDHHFANGAHGSEESSPRESLLDSSYNNRDFVRSENKLIANEENETFSSAQYEMLVTRYQF